MKNSPTRTRKTITQLRMERGLSREQVAVGAQCSYDTIRDIERGKTIPGALIAERLYLFFEVPVGTIQWGKAEAPKSSVA